MLEDLNHQMESHLTHNKQIGCGGWVGRSGTDLELGMQLSNEKKAPGCFGYIGDEILPTFVGNIININHYEDSH